MDPLVFEEKGGVTVVRMQDGKANTLGASMVEALAAAAERLSAAGRGGVVLTGAGRFFSAGLNLGEVLALDRPALSRFLDLFERMTLGWFCMPRPVVAAVNGHAIAGGTVMALTADFRLVANSELRMGLNEVQLGISLPRVVPELVRLQVAPPAVNRVLLAAETFGADEAVAIGLADRAVPAEMLEEEAVETAARLARSPGRAYASTKAGLRGEARRRIEAERAGDREAFLDSLFDPAVKAHIQATLEALRSKKK
ncbi:MAG: enoyl-CoA hydratase/isomerase family protein [Planctomycetes bacterium]|nr:enoyl-CoA hydratase/isomerase family protein [Planctomycetota bacterium]